MFRSYVLIFELVNTILFSSKFQEFILCYVVIPGWRNHRQIWEEGFHFERYLYSNIYHSAADSIASTDFSYVQIIFVNIRSDSFMVITHCKLITLNNFSLSSNILKDIMLFNILKEIEICNCDLPASLVPLLFWN